MQTPNPENPTKPRRRPGYLSHKPGCNCIACKAARKRQEASDDGTTGVGGQELVPVGQPVLIGKPSESPLNADPVLVAPSKERRDKVAQWILFRAQGMPNTEIAPKLGMTVASLHSMVSKATREGWLTFDNAAERLEFELAPLIVDNVKYWLEKKDREMTVRAAQGIGLFKAHQAVKVENQNPPMVLALKIEAPALPDNIKVVEGMVVGRARLPGGEDESE